MQPRVNPSSSSVPIPTQAEVERFRDLYQQRIGVHLDSATATHTLTDLVQFYFLTHGQERYQRRQQIPGDSPAT